MKITVLIENDAVEKYKNEHGLSFYIEYNGTNILLDAGASNQFADNAQSLNINLKNVDMAVLSHSHYDHGDGLLYFLQLNNKARIFMCPNYLKNYYSKREGKIKYIGLSKELKSELNNRNTEFADGEISDGIFLVLNNSGNIKLENRDLERAALYVENNGAMELDQFSHEQTLVVMLTDNRMAIFSSCSHIGIINVIKLIKSRFQNREIAAVIGGCHFLGNVPGVCGFSEEEVKRIGMEMIELGVKKLYTGHCTLNDGYKYLEEVMGDRIHHLKSGESFEIY